MLDYLSGRLTRREQHLFERELMSDPFEAEAMEGLSKLSAQELSDDLAQLEASLTYRQNRRLGTVLWRAAAIVLLMLIPASLLWLFVTQTSNNENGQIAQNKAVTEEPINDSTSESEHTKQQARNVEIVPAKQPSTKDNEKDPVEALEIQTDADQEISSSNNIESSAKEQLNTYAEASGIAITDREQPKALSANAMTAKSKASPSATIKGKVTDDMGEPLPGAAVTLKGTSTGTVTDFNGQFAITLAPGQSEADVTAGFIGFTSSQATLKADTQNIIVMQSELLALEEVVVVGYGTQKKSVLTGASSTIKSESDEQPVVEGYYPPKPAIGLSKYEKRLSAQVTYPSNGTGKDEQVVLMVEISPSGNILSVEVVKSPGDDFSTTAIKAVKQGPVWQPAIRDGVPTKGTRKIKINFTVPK